MSKSSDYTKITRKKLWLYRIIDFVILFTPVIVYIFVAFANDTVTTAAKVGLAGSIAVSLILTLFNVIAQKRLRCPIWIILLGLFIAIKEWLLPLIIILAITAVLDDLVLTPIIQHYKMALEASKVYDERELEHAIKQETKQ